jgi:hypothetical protein
MASIKSVNDLAKSYVNQAKLVGKKTIGIPDETATPEALREFYSKLGCPEAPEHYTTRLPEGTPEGFALQQDRLGRFQKLFHEVGITRAQGERILSEYVADEVKLITDQGGQLKAEQERAMQDLQVRYGGDYMVRLESAQAVVNQFGDDGIRAKLSDPKFGSLGNDADFIGLMVKVAEVMGEDTAVGSSDGKFASGPAGAKQQIQDLMADPAFVKRYTNKGELGHQDAVNQVLALHRVVSPGKVTS